MRMTIGRAILCSALGCIALGAGPLAARLCTAQDELLDPAWESEPATDTDTVWVADPFRPIDRVWAQADYLHWWIQGYRVPPLVTTTPLRTGAFPGALPDPNATIVVGDKSLNGAGRPGVRARVGYWFDDCRQHGVQFEYFGLEGGGSQFLVNAAPGTFVFRPFFNANPAVNAFDAEQADRVSIGSFSSLYSPAALLRRNLYCCSVVAGGKESDVQTCRMFLVDVIAGYRHFHLGERLTISETASFPPATTFDLVDRFETENQFHGGEIGLIAQMYRGPWKMEGIARVALGNNHATVAVDGSGTTTTPPAPPFASPGGLLAQPTNIGLSSADEFTAIPMFELAISRRVGNHLRVNVGYTFMWFSHAVRPGDQIDLAVDGRWLNPAFVPPGTPPAVRPARRFETSSFWVQGINFGLEWNY